MAFKTKSYIIELHKLLIDEHKFHSIRLLVLRIFQGMNFSHVYHVDQYIATVNKFLKRLDTI